MIPWIAALGEGPAPTPAVEPVSALLTIEGLLFAALSVSAGLSDESWTGRDLIGTPRTFGVVAALVISLVGAAAVRAILVAFTISDSSTADAVIPVALLAGAAAPPLFAWWIALSLPGRDG